MKAFHHESLSLAHSIHKLPPARFLPQHCKQQDQLFTVLNNRLYSYIYTRRNDNQLSNLGRCVVKVHRTINGNQLLGVAKGSADSAKAIKESIARVRRCVPRWKSQNCLYWIYRGESRPSSWQGAEGLDHLLDPEKSRFPKMLKMPKT